MENSLSLIAGSQSFPWAITSVWVLVVLLVWSLAWKGIALWKAARLGSKPWFVALLVINTVGILEIIYIFFVARKKTESQSGSAPMQ